MTFSLIAWVVLRGGRLKGIFLCSIKSPKQGGGAFIKAGAFIGMFTVDGRIRERLIGRGKS